MPIGVAGIIAGGGLLSSLIGGGAARSAADTQARAAENALALQRQIYGQTTQNLAPFLAQGTQGLNALVSGLGTGGGGFDPNAPLLQNPQATLGMPQAAPSLPIFQPTGFQQSPGYAWQLGQGINAIQNAATGPQGSLSGNMLRAAGTYGQGLANQDYYNWINQVYGPQFQSQVQAIQWPYGQNLQNYWKNVGQATDVQQNQLRALSGLASLGGQAAVQQGQFGQNFAGAGGDLLNLAGSAQATGQQQSANALIGGIRGITGGLLAPQSTYANSLLGNLFSGSALNPAVFTGLYGGGGQNVLGGYGDASAAQYGF